MTPGPAVRGTGRSATGAVDRHAGLRKLKLLSEPAAEIVELPEGDQGSSPSQRTPTSAAISPSPVFFFGGNRARGGARRARCRSFPPPRIPLLFDGAPHWPPTTSSPSPNPPPHDRSPTRPPRTKRHLPQLHPGHPPRRAPSGTHPGAGTLGAAGSTSSGSRRTRARTLSDQSRQSHPTMSTPRHRCEHPGQTTGG